MPWTRNDGSVYRHAIHRLSLYFFEPGESSIAFQLLVYDNNLHLKYSEPLSDNEIIDASLVDAKIGVPND